MTTHLNDYFAEVVAGGKAGTWYPALALTLALPDICATIEHPDDDIGERYAKWCEEFVVKKQCPNLTGWDFYALRCTFLHTGTGDLSKQGVSVRARMNTISIFRSEAVCFFGEHGSRITCIPRQKGRYAIAIGQFCGIIIMGAENWVGTIASDPTKLAELDELLVIYPSVEFCP